MSYKICFIGAGNLATHLSLALQATGNEISQVYSRTLQSAKELASKLNCSFTNATGEIHTEPDIYFVALTDSAVNEVLSKISFNNKLVVHCSGSLGINILDNYSRQTGVFYPLQTFSKNRAINFKNIPVFIEANSPKTENILLNLGKTISNSVSVLNTEKRKYLHIAAVFACNFTNHMYTIANELLKEKDIPFEVLRPLIFETASRVQEMVPKDAQTGPAVRFDKNIIDFHLNELKRTGNYSELYNSISKCIFEYHKK